MSGAGPVAEGLPRWPAVNGTVERKIFDVPLEGWRWPLVLAAEVQGGEVHVTFACGRGECRQVIVTLVGESWALDPLALADAASLHLPLCQPWAARRH